jgi:hypothetical protein
MLPWLHLANPVTSLKSLITKEVLGWLLRERKRRQMKLTKLQVNQVLALVIKSKNHDSLMLLMRASEVSK